VGGDGFDAYSTDGTDAINITSGAGLECGGALLVDAGTVAVYEEKDGTRSLTYHSKWDGFGSRVHDANFHKSYGGPGMNNGSAVTTTAYDYRDSRYSRHQASVGCAPTTAPATSVKELDSKRDQGALWQDRYVHTKSGWMRKVGFETPAAASQPAVTSAIKAPEPSSVVYQGDRSEAMIEALRNSTGVGEDEERMTPSELEAMHDAQVAELEQRAKEFSLGGGYLCEC
jgi:hypothetical protein